MSDMRVELREKAGVVGERSRPFEAAILDMDGVLTDTARLHERAWKETFDVFLAARGEAPFSQEDYRLHVDGKPRSDGIVDFLASRGLTLPRGEASDPPDADTVAALGKRKNARFLTLLERVGVEVFEDSVVALERWRRGGLRLAVISASRNCRSILRRADLERRVEVVVDGNDAATWKLAGKAGIMREAARRLGVSPADAVLVEDATAGVRAARDGGFGLVVGVARSDGVDLRAAGAHVVCSDLSRLRFPRRLPSALSRLEALAIWRRQRPLALFLDYDGTLAPIVDDPAAARMSESMRRVIFRLAERSQVAIVSGRDRRDVEQRVGIDGIIYAGNHGFDISGPGYDMTLPEAEARRGTVNEAADGVERALRDVVGVVIERKRYSVAIHYRMVREAALVERVFATVEEWADKTGLRCRVGKKVLELEPAIAWDKGRALRWLIEVLPGIGTDSSFLVYIGDDETDEDAFAALGGDGMGVRVGEAVTSSLADYRLADPAEVEQLLRRLARW